jgi:autotransporter-associated beta strand protein
LSTALATSIHAASSDLSRSEGGGVGPGGGLIVTGNAFRLGSTTAAGNQTLNLAGVGAFEYNNSAGAFIVNTGFNSSTPSNATLTLAIANKITSNILDIGNTATVSTASPNVSVVDLGQNNTINASAINVGTGLRGTGTLKFQAVANPQLKIRGSAGGDSRASLLVGAQSGFSVANTGTVDLTSGITGVSLLDAMVDNLIIGKNFRTASSGASSIATGTFSFGGGILDARVIIIGQDTAGGDGPSGSVTSSTLNFGNGGGTVKVQSLILGDKSSASINLDMIANLNLDNGGTLRAQFVQAGNSASPAVVRNFNWTDGTIRNYDASTDLAIDAGLTLNLSETGTHTFNIDADRTATVRAVLSDATSNGSLVKAGLGTLTLAATNAYSGATTVNEGRLLVNGSISGGTATVNGGTLGGIGTVGSTTINAGGTFAPGASIGTLNIAGALTLGGNAIFEIEKTGITLTADRANILGALTLGGTLTVIATGDKLTMGDSVDLFDATSMMGSFVSFNLPSLDSDLSWDTTNLGVNGTLVVVPEPGSGVLLLAGVGVLAGLLRSRTSRKCSR